MSFKPASNRFFDGGSASPRIVRVPAMLEDFHRSRPYRPASGRTLFHV
jgi:hypothetical protein